MFYCINIDNEDKNLCWSMEYSHISLQFHKWKTQVSTSLSYMIISKTFQNYTRVFFFLIWP